MRPLVDTHTHSPSSNWKGKDRSFGVSYICNAVDNLRVRVYLKKKNETGAYLDDSLQVAFVRYYGVRYVAHMGYFVIYLIGFVGG